MSICEGSAQDVSRAPKNALSLREERSGTRLVRDLAKDRRSSGVPFVTGPSRSYFMAWVWIMTGPSSEQILPSAGLVDIDQDLRYGSVELCGDLPIHLTGRIEGSG